MTNPNKVLQVRFYRNATGNEPVREWLLELNKEDRKIVGVDLLTAKLTGQAQKLTEKLTGQAQVSNN